jgi:predicted aminopeptidase
MRNAQDATANLTNARQCLEDAKFLARNGMANNLAFATHVEHVAFHNWLRAGEAFQSYRG